MATAAAKAASDAAFLDAWRGRGPGLPLVRRRSASLGPLPAATPVSPSAAAAPAAAVGAVAGPAAADAAAAAAHGTAPLEPEPGALGLPCRSAAVAPEPALRERASREAGQRFRRALPRPEGAMRIAVLTQRPERVELEVPLDETAGGVRRRLAARGEVWGPPLPQEEPRAAAQPCAARRRGGADEAYERRFWANEERLLFHGVPLEPEVPLREAGVKDGCVLRLLPALRNTRLGHAPAAARGLLMAPGNKPWAPATARGPREPLLYEADAPYSANLVCPELLARLAVRPSRQGPKRFVVPRTPSPGRSPGRARGGE